MEFTAIDAFQLIILLTWTCLESKPPQRKNPLFARFFTSFDVLESIATGMSISFCPGLFEVLQAATPPPIEFFKSLPTVRKLQWAAYVLVLEKPGCKTKIYIGSATCTQSGVANRFKQYNNLLVLSTWVKDAIENGYEIVHKGLLYWSPIPPAGRVPIDRLMFKALEATFTYIFWALKGPAYAYMKHICPWDNKSLVHGGLCGHCCLDEAVKGDFDLTEEQLEAVAVDAEEKKRVLKAENGAKWHLKQMETNLEHYRARGRARNARYRVNNHEKVLADRAELKIKALDAGTYHCETCNVSFGTQSTLQDHLKSDKHMRSLKNPAPYRCVPCSLGFWDRKALKRHQKDSQRHHQRVAELKSTFD